MAAAGWLIVVCSGGSLALDVTALVLAVLAECCIPGVIQFTLNDPHQRLCMMLLMVAVPGGASLLLVESCWLKYERHYQQQQPPPEPADVRFLVVLMAFEWLLAFVTVAAASSALIVDLVATPVCASYQLAADAMACAAGALAAAAAVGLLWVVGTRDPVAPCSGASAGSSLTPTLVADGLFLGSCFISPLSVYRDGSLFRTENGMHGHLV